MNSETAAQISKIKELFADGWISEYERDKRIKELDPNHVSKAMDNNVAQSYDNGYNSMNVDSSNNNNSYNSYISFDSNTTSYSNNNVSNEIVFKSYDDIPVLNEKFTTLDINQTNKSNTYNHSKPKEQPKPQPIEPAKPVQAGSFGAMFVTSSNIGNTAHSIVKIVGDNPKKIQFVPLGTTCQTYIDIRSFIRSSNSNDAPDQPTDPTKDQWRQEQHDLAKKVDIKNVKNLSIKKENCNIKYIGGVDISFGKGSSIDACACLVVIEYPSLRVVYQSYKMIKLTEPYIAGYLAFREAPHLIPLWKDLLTNFPQYKPDVMIIDGNGINHMRACGSACHMGVLMDIPTIGVAKQLLYANGITEQYITNGFKKGNIVEMFHQHTNQSLGHAIYNSQKEIIYISPGHKLDTSTALAIVQATMNNRPIPESTFQADKLSRDFLYKYYTQFPTR